MRDKIDSLARQIRNTYDQLHQGARSAREANQSLIVKIAKNPISVSVCAVDGGFLSHRMHGADIAVVRAVGVNFVYERSNLKSFSYYPQKSPEPDLEIRNNLDEHESIVFRSLVRLKCELQCAIDCVKKFSPDVILMDGSLLPLPSDRPSESSELHPVYNEVLSLYVALQNACFGKCMLCGIIKDSRSRKLSKDLGFSCSDGVLCSFMLEEGERTASMPYYDEKPNKDMVGLADKVTVFYMKPSKNDLPLRIEAVESDSDKVASIIYALSAISENFAYPAILIEADMCAALDGKELESIESSLISLSGMRPLRRNSRPFR